MQNRKHTIKNLIGNNPFRVRNYIPGVGLDNPLLPKKLLMDKTQKFENDEEFIDDFLKKHKQE